MVTRSELRQLFSEAVDDTGKGITVFNGRHIDALHDSLPAAVVAFEAVEAEMDLDDNFRFRGEMSVLLLVNGTDDQLDLFVDPVVANCMARMRSQLPTTGCTFNGIAYQRDIDPGVAGALLTWDIIFNG